MNIAIACGGTGGHVMPGLCTARVLRGRGHAVTLWLSGRDVENTAARDWDGPVVAVEAAGFGSGPAAAHAAAALTLAEAAVEAGRRMAADRPDVVLGMGGYGSVGPVVAARLRRIPVVLHEANAVAGRAVALLAWSARAVGTAFAETAGLPACRPRVRTGLPLRPEVVRGGEAPLLEPGPFTVLVMGGSQGAQRLNAAAVEALCRLQRDGMPVRVIHLAGAREADTVRGRYAEAGVDHAVYGFLETMGRAYAAADFAISRAGAGACAELAACGVPALLVPLPGAVRGHQLANACALEEHGAADLAEETELTPDWLTVYLKQCMQHPEKRDAMRHALKALAVTDGAARLADLVEANAGRR
ncbi:MAG: UDP-N-acetylglucosamine--N-acetylmuramyl-(pentapeptide) pyrophosphoryl-undecaprenol N-acetylglucosamine transferase [Lentisphaerae bacterium]|nr:UDP-N-acetylglucosamine--N-acetylmuramyl-(pentapeptide) pyrophosphoryl-undecaprenol N-acetylglucosamine transferase [Lentisphaerota bacterium]